MRTVPITLNSIQIPLIEKGCCKWGFDSDYPHELAGIIRPHEFEESISNINKQISPTPRIICSVLMIVCSISGFIMFIFGTIQVPSLKVQAFILLGGGFGLFLFGLCSTICGFCILNKKLAHRLRPIIADESRKYINRSPASCSWQLKAKTVLRGNGKRGRIDVLLYIIIDYNRASNLTNRSVPYQYPQTTTPPPPYTHVSDKKFCTQCGTVRTNIIDQFCTQCGQAFNGR